MNFAIYTKEYPQGGLVGIKVMGKCERGQKIPLGARKQDHKNVKRLGTKFKKFLPKSFIPKSHHKMSNIKNVLGLHISNQ